MLDEGLPWPELALAAEMLRVLGDRARTRESAILDPATAAALLRQSADLYSCSYDLRPDYAVIRRDAECIAMFLYFSVWRGQILQATESVEGPVGPPTYEIKVGHCGESGCCGPYPLLCASAGESDD